MKLTRREIENRKRRDQENNSEARNEYRETEDKDLTFI